MPIPLGMEVREREVPPPPPPLPPPRDTRLDEVLDALRTISYPPAPIVQPPDLSDIVTAVTSLKPGPTAAEIAAAIADVIRMPEGDTAPLREVAEALRNLDFRMQGMGRQAYGGGAVHLEQGTTFPVTGSVEIANDVGNPIPVSGTVTTTGLTDTQLRATPVPVSLTSNDVSDRAARLLGHVTVDSAPTTAVTGPLTDTQLRASRVPVDGSGVTQPVSGTFWQATQPVSGTFFQATQPVSLATNTPDVTDRSARLLGHVTVDNASIPVTGTFFQATQPVSLAATVTTKETRSATPTQSSVAASLTNVTLLASNANRLGATVYNDDTASVLSLKLGATASSTSFTLKVAAGGYYEVPFGYTGIIDGIWNVATGSARITELT